MKKPVVDPDPKKRKEQLKNVLRELARNPGNRVAVELKAELDERNGAEAQSAKPKRKGDYDWDPHPNEVMSKSHGRYKGEVFATITKEKTHTLNDDDVFSLEVLGERVPEKFRHINEARDEAKKLYDERLEKD